MSEIDHTSCPSCGDDRLGWRLQRRGSIASPDAERIFLWECRGCGSSWHEHVGHGSQRPTAGSSCATPPSPPS